MHHIVFHRKDHNFLMACILFSTYHIGFQTMTLKVENEVLKHAMFLLFFKYRRNKRDFRWNFENETFCIVQPMGIQRAA